MNNHEDAFAEEAQEQAILSERRRAAQNTPSKNIRIAVDAAERYSDEDNESSPLIERVSDSSSFRPAHHRGASYERAINEPWTGAHGTRNLPWYKKPSIYWLLPAFFPVCVAFGGIIVPQTYLIQDLICRDLFKDRALKDPTFTFSPIVVGGTNDECGQDDEVQSRTAIFNLIASLLSGIFAAIVAPYLGALSDRYGRLKVIIAPIFGAFIAELIVVVVGTHPEQISVYWILLGSFADGIFGSFTTSMVLCFAYASDCTAPERRNVAFGHFHANLFAGIALGPLLAAALIKFTGKIMVPFYFALSCQLFFMLFLSAIVPESLSKERQKIARDKYRQSHGSKPAWQKWSALSLLSHLSILWPQGEGSSSRLRRNLITLATIDTMMFGVAMGTLQIVILYARKRFGWDPVASSGFMSIVNVSRVLGLLVIFPAVVRLVRGRFTGQSTGHQGSDRLDINIIRTAILFDLVGYLGYAMAPTGVFMILSGVIASLGGVGPPTLQSSMTKHLPSDRTGQILGASGLLHALARVVAPVVFNLIYSKTVRYYSGIVFYCLASIFVFVFLLSWLLYPGVYLKDENSLSGSAETEESDLIQGEE